jgi:hypothetical protein
MRDLAEQIERSIFWAGGSAAPSGQNWRSAMPSTQARWITQSE